MLSKTIFAATALVAAAAATDLPTCWSDCFAKYEVDSEGCLCSDGLGSVVSSCIASGCESADSDAYSAWLSSYCYVAPVSSNTWSAPASTYVVPSSVWSAPSYPSASASSAPVYSAPVYSAPSSAPVYSAPVYSSAPASAPVYSSAPAYPSSSGCAASTTLIWRSSTSVVPVYGGVPATGTAPSYPAASSWAPVPATGAGTKLAGAGLAAFAGVAAALL